MNEQIKILKSNFKKENLVIIYNNDKIPNPNFLYYTGNTNVSGILVVPRTKPAFMLTNARDYEKAKNSELSVLKLKKKKKSFDYLDEILNRKKINCKKIGIDKENFNLLVFERLKKYLKGRYYDVSGVCKKQRSIKTEPEISYLKSACTITDNVFSKLIKKFRFNTELEIRNFIESEIKKQGAELSFKPIVASGNNSSNPHYDSLEKLKKGFLVLDFGARYKGYHADMTRTLYLGKPSEKEKNLYYIVLKNQMLCLDSLRQGVPASIIYNFSLNNFGKYAEYFVHGLGHGLGFEIHEFPNLSADSKEVLADNMVFTIEPGLYFEGKFGIRIEDSILLKNNKIHILTKSKKELIIINR
ncbi:aminopeptidase P family protein [Candidatus Woesearchaeota archaeon]|nr:aminopeptidase P family protein [Candidatus Woesearchaeota archaeon]